MSKLIEQNQPKKSRFLKYSLLASISVGAIIAMPFEGMAMSINPLFLDVLNKKLLNGLSQSNENKDTTNTPQQIGKVMTVPFEGMASSGSTESLVSLSKEDHSNSIKNDNAINILKNRPKSFGASDNKKKRPPTRSKTFVGSEKIEQSQNTYTSKPTVQTLQKPEIIITASSPTVSPASNSFVTAPTIQNTTLLSAPQSPEHIYQNTPPSTAVSSPSTPYKPTPKSKPNDGVRANTSQKPKAARKISFSEPQQTVQLSKPTVPPRPIASVQLPIKRSSTEVAVEIISHISGYRENAMNKLSAVTTAIEKTSDQKDRKKAQDIKKQIISQQKNIQKIESQAKEKADKIKELDQINSTLYDYNKRVTSDNERTKNKLQIGKNKNKIKKLETELASKKNEADKLSQKIDISVNKVVLTKPQEKAPVTEIPKAGLFLNQQQQLDMLTQHQRVNAARQAEVNRKKAEANEVKRNSSEYKDLINEREGVQLEQNQQYIAAEKTKKQQQAENKQRSEREKKRKEENHQKEKARYIVNIREDIVAKMQQILNTDTTLQITLHKLQELKAEAIEDKKKKQEAQNLLSEIKKQEKAIKTAADKAQGILEKAKKETSGTEIRKLQTKMNGYYETVTNGKIAVDIQNLERLVLTPSAPPSTATIYNKVKPIMPLTPGVQGILGKQPEEEDGYLVPIQGKPETYITLLPTDPKSMDSGLGSRTSDTEFSSNHNSNKAYENLSPIEPENQQQHETAISSSMYNYIHFEEKSAVLQTTTTDESLRSKKNWKNPAPYSSSPEFDKKQSEYLDLADNISTQNPKQSDILEALDLITPKQKTTAAKSDSLRKSNVSGSIPEIQQPQSEKMHTETLGVQNDLGLDLHSQEGRFDSGFFGSLESQNLSSAYDFDQLSASWDAAYSQRMNTNAKDAPQETLTENSASSEKKKDSIIKRAVSKVGSILQTNDAENRKRKRDGETSKQSTVDQEAGFGQDWGNEYHKEPSLSVDSGLIKKAAHLISFLDAKRTEIQQATSPLQQKSLNSALQEIENDYQEAIKISQELQQILIHRPENAKAYNAKAERKLDDIKNRADKHFSNIETDADVGFNPNWGNSHSMPTANINSLSKNLAVTSPINVGSLYNSPQAQQFREEHKNIIINTINSISSSGVPKESIDPTIIKSLPYLDNDQYQEVVLRVDRVHDINTRGYLLSKLKQLGESEVRELTGVYASIYNTAPPEVLGEAAALLDRSQGRLNLVDSTIKKGTQPLSNLSTIYEPVSYENLASETLASETIYKTEQPKPSISYKNTSKQKLPIPLFRSAELDKKLDYLDLEDKLLKVEEARIVKEKQAIATLNQYQDPENLEFQWLAIEALDLSSKESQLKEKRKAIEAGFSLNEEYSSTDVSSSRPYSVGDIISLLSDTESNLSRSSSVSSLNNLSSPNIMKLGELKSKHEKIANDYKAKELELDTLNQDDPKFKELMLEVFEMSKDKIWLEGEIKHLDTESKPKVAESKPVFSRSSSVDSINSVSSDKDLLWDNTGDIGVSHRYGAEDSCPTPDQSSSKTVNISNKNSSETKLALLRTYQMAVTVKRQELEQLPSTSLEVDQIAQQIEELKEMEQVAHNVLSRLEREPSVFDQYFSFEEINEELKQLGAGIPESVINVLESKAQKDPEDLASNGKSESTLPTEGEESEDKEVTDVSRELSLLPVSSNDCALALSDCREKECLALGDGSKDEEDDEGYNSGFEEEEETIEQLSDSDGSNLETTAIDTAISLEQEAKKEMQTQISENAPTLNQAKVVNSIVNNMIRNRLDASINMSNNMVAVGAGDEEEVCIKRGLWVRGMYGINNHGRVENINGYRGTNKGATIGFDVEIDNNIVGIAYSNVHSVFKFKNSKNNDKEIIDSHVVSIYGQKELPKDFALQALVSASKNFIKDKTTYLYGDNKIRSNVKHRNHSYNAEALLNYNYLVKNNIVITPNIGLRYGKSRDGVYNETGINVQEIALTMKENNILSGIVGTKVKVPLKDALKFNNLGLTFQGAVEHNFKEKTQRINRVVKIFDTEFKQNYAIPKQPKTSYNLGTGIMGSIKNTTISLDYNYYLNKHYRSHQGSVKLKVNL